MGELRTKAIVVYVDRNSVTVKPFLGLGRKKTYKIEDLSGYKLSILSSRGGAYEYFYLIVEEKKVVKLSEFYHQNYRELKTELIRKNIKNLGTEHWPVCRLSFNGKRSIYSFAICISFSFNFSVSIE